MKHTKKALEEFYLDTRHKEHDIETPKAMDLFVKKYIALHCGGNQNKDIYPYVACDLQRLDKRTDGGVIKRYAQKPMDENVHTYLFSNCTQYNVDSPLLRDFQEKVLPRPENEQRWQSETRADQWKDLAFLMAHLCHGNKADFRSHLQHIVDAEPVSKEWSNKANFEKLCKALATYATEHATMTPEDVQDVGKLINSMQWKDIDDERLFLVEPQQEFVDAQSSMGDEESVVSEDEDDIVLPIAADPVEWSLDKEASLRSNPLILDYKKVNGLSNQFDARKAAKQLVILNSLNGSNEIRKTNELLQSVAAKRQSTFNNVSKFEPEHWRHALNSVVDSADDLQTALSHPHVKAFYSTIKNVVPEVVQERWKNGSDIVRAYLNAHAKIQSSNETYAKAIEVYLKKNGAYADKDVIKSIIDEK